MEAYLWERVESMGVIRRWCVLVLAIALVGTNAVYQWKTTLSVHESEQIVKIDEESREAAAQVATEDVIEKVIGEKADMNRLSAKELVEGIEENNKEVEKYQISVIKE